MDSHKTVITNKGAIKGYLAKDGDYYSFIGIPYADAPIGINRFKSPQPVQPWNGTFEATRKVVCPQRGTGEEDCLTVNVFTPIESKHALPVLVFFHGGSFIIGAGYTSGFHPIVSKGVIVVTVNYRLGALGFLCLGVEDAPGNAGLKDQVAALKWVKDNIQQFGGNPEEVTIYGMSAGSVSVEYLLLSNKGKGLFKRGIMESASALSSFATAIDPIATAVAVGTALQFPNVTDMKELVSKYQTVSAHLLSEITYDYYTTGLRDGNFGFVPCVERDLKDSFITESPNNILLRGDFEKVPLMYAFTSAEGLYLNSEKFYEEDYASEMNENFASFMPYDLIFDTDAIKRRVGENVKRFYFGNDSISEHTKLSYLKFFGDYFVLYPMMKSLELHKEESEKPIYLFEFAYKGEMGSEESFYKDIKLAGHGDIVKHAFLTRPVLNADDCLAVNRISTIITNFVKNGNPLPSPTKLMNVSWPPIQSETLTYIHIGNDVQILENPYQERIKIWDDLYKKYRKPITQVDPFRELNALKQKNQDLL